VDFINLQPILGAQRSHYLKHWSHRSGLILSKFLISLLVHFFELPSFILGQPASSKVILLLLDEAASSNPFLFSLLYGDSLEILANTSQWKLLFMAHVLLFVQTASLHPHHGATSF
jgi:hypothetical protein